MQGTGIVVRSLMFVLLLVPLVVPYGFADEVKEEEEQLLMDLLQSNFDETPYTALVRIVEVEKLDHELLYRTYRFTCEVLETFKGKRFERVAFLRGFEEEPEAVPIAKVKIISLFHNEEQDTYYMGDNAYDLPASDDLIEEARRLASDSKNEPHCHPDAEDT